MAKDIDFLRAGIKVAEPKPVPQTFCWEEVCSELKIPADSQDTSLLLRLMDRGFIKPTAMVTDLGGADFMVTPDGHAYAESPEATGQTSIHVEGSSQVAVAVGGSASQNFTINLNQTLVKLEQMIDAHPDLDDEQKEDAKSWVRKAGESPWGPAVLQTLAQLVTGLGGVM